MLMLSKPPGWESLPSRRSVDLRENSHSHPGDLLTSGKIVTIFPEIFFKTGFQGLLSPVFRNTMGSKIDLKYS